MFLKNIFTAWLALASDASGKTHEPVGGKKGKLDKNNFLVMFLFLNTFPAGSKCIYTNREPVKQPPLQYAGSSQKGGNLARIQEQTAFPNYSSQEGHWNL